MRISVRHARTGICIKMYNVFHFLYRQCISVLSSRAICLSTLCLCLSVMSGCKYVTQPPFVGFELPEDAGPPIYRLGYKHGCKSGFGAYAVAFYKPFNKWEQDPELVDNKMYYQIWKDAYSFCAMYGLMHSSHGWGNFR